MRRLAGLKVDKKQAACIEAASQDVRRERILLGVAGAGVAGGLGAFLGFLGSFVVLMLLRCLGGCGAGGLGSGALRRGACLSHGERATKSQRAHDCE